MDTIILKNTLPHIFRNEANMKSGIWKQELSFERGKYYLVEANSGTGKSSLCSYIYGYREDYSGDILFDGDNIRGFKPKRWDNIRRKELSLLFQELCLFPELTAWENIKLKNNLTGYKTDKQIGEMFDKLSIADKRDVKIAQMSWGQQQRIALIRSLCQPFGFLLLDEPISHLDDDNAALLAELVHSEASQQGAGVIVTSIGKHLPLDYYKTLAL